MYDLTRRNFLRSSVATAAVAAGAWAAPEAASAAARRPFIAYGPRSYFRRPIKGAAIDRARTRAFRSFMRKHPDQRDWDYPRINGTSGNGWGTPYAMGTAKDPVWRLTGEHNPMARRLEARGFHAPEWLGEMLTGTSDSPLCVIDKASGFTMFCANAELVGDRVIRANAGAITFHDSNGLDHRHPRSNDPRNFSSRGRISDAMVIRRDLVRYGVKHNTDLGHVLHLFLAETRSSDGFTGPMVGAESGKYGFGAEGERIAIRPGLDLRELDLSPEALVVARTLKRYGAYIGDNSGSQSCLKAEQENSTRPVWNGRLAANALKNLSWDDFVVLR